MKAKQIIAKMMHEDAFSQWLGIEIIELSEGFCVLKMTTRTEMLNGFGILHGGICYSLADSTLAFASNSRGFHAVSIDTQISHLKKIGPNEVLFAKSKEISSGKTISLYQIEIHNDKKDLVALFKGTVYKSAKAW
jgi:acyl-CoA thioesterase